MKRYLVLFMTIIVCISLLGCGSSNATSKNSSVQNNSQPAENPINSLKVQPGWTWEVDKYGYSKVSGSVKNIGTKPIQYFEVTAEFLGENNNVLDTTYTNSGETINPGNEKRFEIMHKYSKDFKTARVYVNRVVFK